MFKQYKDICDVVSLLVYCPSERSYLLTKDTSGEFWIPSSKAEKHCWKMTAHKIYFELFGMDAVAQCVALRVYKVWLPYHPLTSVYHAVYKVPIKNDIKKRIKMTGLRSRFLWFSTVELERQRAHSTLRSPEVSILALMAVGDQPKEDSTDFENGLLVEVCEENVIIGADIAGGTVALSTPNYQLLQAANYNREDQLRMYREFLIMVFPALYMSPQAFTQFMLDIGWQRSQCSSLFRAADLTGRGGLSYLEFILWAAALEPATQHNGVPAEIRCRYIFRYFDNNRDLKLEYVEFKELVAAARAARQLPVDALSVARDADVCLSPVLTHFFRRQLGMQPNSQLPLAEFLRGISELRLRGTSSLLRAPRSIIGYLADLHERDCELTIQAKTSLATASSQTTGVCPQQPGDNTQPAAPGSLTRRPTLAPRLDYSIALHTVRICRHGTTHNEMTELHHFDEDAVSASTARLLRGGAGGAGAAVTSLEVLGPTACPTEAMAAVHYFATAYEKPITNQKRASVGTTTSVQGSKAACSWTSPTEEAAMGALLLRLAEAIRAICATEPRLLRITSPVYAIGDLHGNLCALLAMEKALWPSGAALAPAKLLFLGDYVDRGPHGTELMAYLMAAKLQRPNGVFLIRGNHETRDIQKMFTFYTECLNKYGDLEGAKIWNAINQVFDVLPLAAVVDDKIFCCHGGIPPPWVCPLATAIDKVPVPLCRPAEQSTIAWELLWNDPIRPNKLTATLALELSANEGFAANAKRGTGHVFDQNALDRFLLANQLSHVVRAHELHQSGFMCQLRGRLITVFSSSHYCGGTNDSGIALLEGGKLRLIRLTDN